MVVIMVGIINVIVFHHTSHIPRSPEVLYADDSLLWLKDTKTAEVLMHEI